MIGDVRYHALRGHFTFMRCYDIAKLGLGRPTALRISPEPQLGFKGNLVLVSLQSILPVRQDSGLSNSILDSPRSDRVEIIEHVFQRRKPAREGNIAVVRPSLEQTLQLI